MVPRQRRALSLSPRRPGGRGDVPGGGRERISAGGPQDHAPPIARRVAELRFEGPRWDGRGEAPRRARHLRELAARSHRGTRFYFDGGFPTERCDALYEAWIERGFRDPDRRIRVAAIDGDAGRLPGGGTPGDGCGSAARAARHDDPHQRAAASPGPVLSAMRHARERGRRRRGRSSAPATSPRSRLTCASASWHERVEVWHHKWYDAQARPHPVQPAEPRRERARPHGDGDRVRASLRRRRDGAALRGAALGGARTRRVMLTPSCTQALEISALLLDLRARRRGDLPLVHASFEHQRLRRARRAPGLLRDPPGHAQPGRARRRGAHQRADGGDRLHALRRRRLRDGRAARDLRAARRSSWSRTTPTGSSAPTGTARSDRPAASPRSASTRPRT